MNALSWPFEQPRLDVTLEREVARSLRRRAALSLLLLEVRGPVDTADRDEPMEQRMLAYVTGAIALSLRDEDIACRYESDRFAVILPDIGVRQARLVAGKICANLEALAGDDGGPGCGRLSVSVGLASLPPARPAESDDALFAAADRACAVAREIGGICVVEGALPAGP